MKNNKGFTLIELLVVIAIIGILAAIVLVSLRGARTKALDTRVETEAAQVASIAELYYSDNGYSFAGLCENSSELQKVINSINSIAGAQAICRDDTECGDEQQYCFSAQKPSGGWYCIDSNGNKQTNASSDPCATDCDCSS